MKITRLIWLDYFVEKLAHKHGVSTDEVAELFANKPRIQRLERGDVQGEDLYRALGQADDGRYLAVSLFVKARLKPLSSPLVI